LIGASPKKVIAVRLKPLVGFAHGAPINEHAFWVVLGNSGAFVFYCCPKVTTELTRTTTSTNITAAICLMVNATVVLKVSCSDDRLRAMTPFKIRSI
jgi:hypothetical protein